MIWDEVLWHWASPVWFIAASLLATHVAVFRGRALGKYCVLTLGVLMLLAAFVSPIGVLADGFLFSAHMLQHLLLLLVVPMCLLISVPHGAVSEWFHQVWPGRWGELLSSPILGWMCGVGAMWFWHVPTFCSAANQYSAVGMLRDLSFVLAGLVFWWPIYSPVESFRLPPLSGIAYLFSACLGCTLLGIYITFTSISVCPAFANPPARANILNMLYDAGLTPGMDQQIAGLLMWVPPCGLYIGVIVGLLCRWYSAAEPITAPTATGVHNHQLTACVERA